MLLESRIEKMVGELRAHASLPLAIELWNGKRYALGDKPTVTLRVPAASALRYLVNADLAKLGEAYVEGHIDVVGPIGDAMRAAEGLAPRGASPTIPPPPTTPGRAPHDRAAAIRRARACSAPCACRR